MLTALAAALFCVLAQAPAKSQLVADLDALRQGEPGQPAFDAAAPSLGALLESRDDALVPGAAYVIGTHGLQGYENLLLATLRSEAQRPATEPGRSFAHVLDALVQLQAEVPAELVLARTRADNSGLAYVALSSQSDSARALDGLAGLVCLGLREEPAHWAALIELTLARDARAAEELLFGRPWRLEVEVSNPEGGRFGGSYNSRFGYSAPRWPPTVSYRVELPALNGELDGIEFTRLEFSGGCRRTSRDNIDQQGWRARLLRALLPELSLHAKRDFDARIEFAHADQVRAEIERHVAAVRARLGAVVDALAIHELVEPAAKPRLRLHVVLRDARIDAATPLPLMKNLDDVIFELR